MKTPPSFIRTGLLHVPQLDAAAGEAVSKQLIQSLRRVVILQESYATSDRRWLENTLYKWCDEDELDLVLTIGGTHPASGAGSQEIVPEVTLALVERLVPGLPEAMRAFVREEFPAASLHRGVAGIRGRTLLINLPAGAKAAALFLEAIVEDLPYLLAHLRGDAEALTLESILSEQDSEQDDAVEDDAQENEADEQDIHLPVNPSKPIPPAAFEGTEPTESKPAKRAGKGLNAEDFAAFLQRRNEGDK